MTDHPDAAVQLLACIVLASALPLLIAALCIWLATIK